MGLQSLCEQVRAEMDSSTFAVRVTELLDEAGLRVEMTDEEWEDGMSGNNLIPPVEDGLVPSDNRPSELEECVQEWKQRPDYYHERAVWRCTRPDGTAESMAIMAVVVIMIAV